MTKSGYAFANTLDFSLWQKLTKQQKQQKKSSSDDEKIISLDFDLNAKTQPVKVSHFSIDESKSSISSGSHSKHSLNFESGSSGPQANSINSSSKTGGAKRGFGEHSLDFSQANNIKSAKSMSTKVSTASKGYTRGKPILNHMGIIHLSTKSKSNYTIGKGAKMIAANNLDYIAREESNAVVRDKLGNVLSKDELNELKQKIYQEINAERRLVFSPDSRLQLTEEQHSRLVREVMLEYGQNTGKEFDFVFSTHANTDNMHTHVLMLAKHANGDGIKMYKDEVFEMKNIYYEKMHNYMFNIKDGHKEFTDNTLYQKAYESAIFNGHIKQDEQTRERIIDKYNPAYKNDGYEFFKLNRHLVLADFLAERNALELSKDETPIQFLKNNHDLSGAYYDENKNLPSPGIATRASILMDRSDIDIDRTILNSRQDTIKFVKEFDMNPMKFASDSRKELLETLRSKAKTNDDERLKGLITRVKTMQEITVDSLKKNGIDINNLKSYTKSIEIDTVAKQDIESIVDQVSLPTESKESISKLLNTNEYLSVSYLVNQGLSRDEIVKQAEINKVPINLEIVDFKNNESFALKEKNTENIKPLNTRESTTQKGFSNTAEAIEQKEDAQEAPRSPKSKSSYQRIDTYSLNKLTNQEVSITDPAPLLDRLGIDYKTTHGGQRYEFKARDERTASANMYLSKSGEWVYKDFGAERGGSAIQLAMDVLGRDYRDSREFVLDSLGIRDRAKEAFEELGRAKQDASSGVSEEELASIKEKMQQNSYRSKAYAADSQVISAEPLDPNNKQIMNFLNSRGFEIDKMPEWAQLITGEYKKFDAEGRESIKQRFGVGVMFDNGGGDIHYLKPIELPDGETLKTMTFGNKDITTIEPEVPTEENSFAVFESKNDAIATYHQVDKLKEQTIIIAHGTSNISKVVQAVKNGGYEYGDIYNQNDIAGAKFASTLIKDAELEHYSYIGYKDGEYKLDINDLHKEDISLEERRKSGYGIEDAEKLEYETQLEKEQYDKDNENELELEDKRDEKEDENQLDEGMEL
jgi:hypothetical protein